MTLPPDMEHSVRKALSRSHSKWFVPELQPITLKVEDVTDESRYPLICEAVRHAKDAE